MVVEEESMMLGKDAISNSEEFGNYNSFSLQFCLDAKASGGKIDHGQVMKGMELEQNQLKGTECLSHARKNAPVRELSVVLPISAGYSLSLSWLLNWFPRPMVKLKFMAQHDEEMDNEGNVQWVLAKAGKDRIYVVVLEVLGWLCDGDYDAYALSKLQELTMTGVLWCDRDTQRSFMKMEDLENARYEMKLGATMDSVDSLAGYMNTLRDLGDNSRKFAELRIAVGNSARVSKVIEDADFSEVEKYISLPPSWKLMKVNDIDSESYDLSFSCNSPDLPERNTIGVLELSKFLDNGLVNQHSSGRYKEMDMDLKVSTFELAGTAMNLTSVSKCNGFANFLKECCNGVDYDYLVINSTEDFSLESRDYPKVKNSEEEFEVFKLSQYGDFLRSNKWNQRSFILLPIREDALLKEVIIIFPTSTCCYLALKWSLGWDTKPNMKIKCIRVAMPNMFSNIALSISIFTASVHELEAAVELLVYEEGLESHHLHSTSKILARDSSSYASSNNHRSLKRLLVRFPKPMVKIKLRASVVEGHGNATYADNISLRRIRLKRANFNWEWQVKGAWNDTIQLNYWTMMLKDPRRRLLNYLPCFVSYPLLIFASLMVDQFPLSLKGTHQAVSGAYLIIDIQPQVSWQWIVYYESFCACDAECWESIGAIYEGIVTGSYSFLKLAISPYAIRVIYHAKVSSSLRTRKLKGRVLMHDKIKEEEEEQGKGRSVFYL